MQDLELQDGNATSIDKLLLETPGENTVKLNRDLFIKRDTVKAMCPSCAATALYTLQTYAPGKGSGHRKCLRGGGPITTIVTGRTLWEQVWFNVLSEREFLRPGYLASSNNADKFPWLAPTHTSEGDTPIGPNDVHASQVYFGMPERIRLDPDTIKTTSCDICAAQNVSCYTSFFLKKHGVNYQGDVPWGHPLTPYRTNEKEHKTFAVHTDSDGILYRHWLGIMQGISSNDMHVEPARVVQVFRDRKMLHESDLPEGDVRIWSFGYKVDNSKAECWYEAEMPFILVSAAIRELYEMQIAQLIQTADYAQIQLKKFGKMGMYRRPENVKGDFGFFGTLFWQETEAAFYTALSELAKNLSESADTQAVKLSWLRSLTRASLAIYDQYAQSDTIAEGDPKRIVVNRRKLEYALSPRKDAVRKLLQLPEINEDDMAVVAQPGVISPR
jgi:CRISPR system Cascade subunit CasA